MADTVGIFPHDVEPYGRFKAMIALDFLKDTPRAVGKIILVTAINLTPAGEGKTTTSIGHDA